jgi:hypothetical protein
MGCTAQMLGLELVPLWQTTTHVGGMLPLVEFAALLIIVAAYLTEVPALCSELLAEEIWFQASATSILPPN